MKSHRPELMFSILALSWLWSGGAFAQSPSIDWQEDLEFLARELPARHVRAFAKIREQDFQDQVFEIRKRLPLNSSPANAVELMRLAAAIGDGHTAVNFKPESCHCLPLQFHWFPEGIFIIAAGAKEEAAFQGKLLKVGLLPIEQILQQLETVLSHDNQSQFKQLAAQQLSNVELLQGIGAIDNLESISIEFEKGKQTRQIQLRPLAWTEIRQNKWVTLNLASLPYYQRKPQLAHWNDWIADQKTLYFKYNRCQDREAFQKLVNGTIGFIQQNDVQRFVLDLRDNGGGDSSIFEPLLKYLKSNSKLNKPDSLYVIIGRKTFSSAVLNAMSMRETKARFVGEPTGGRPNHFGEVKFIELPSSGMSFSYSTKYFQPLKGGDPDSLEPEIRVELSFADWAAGVDPVLERIFQ